LNTAIRFNNKVINSKHTYKIAFSRQLREQQIVCEILKLFIRGLAFAIATHFHKKISKFYAATLLFHFLGRVIINLLIPDSEIYKKIDRKSGKIKK
jgi:hypothetical protein